MRKILFIYNPISGGKKKDSIVSYIKTNLPESISFDLIGTDYKGHAKEIVLENLKKDYDTIVAVGGDGTINEIAHHLVDTDISLGIIPTGSGNGLARSLGISMNWKKSIDTILNNNVIKIDTLNINELKFFNVAGTGFDSHIAHLFAHNKKRGFLSYVKLTLKEFFSFKSQISSITVDGKNIDIEYFLMSFANSQQFGNNAYISPESSFTDGILEIVILKKFGFFAAFNMAYRLYTKKIHKSKYTSYISCQSITFNEKGKLNFHIDGEPEVLNGPVNIKMNQHSLNVIVK